MNHRNKNNHLGRKYGHRKSLLSNMASSLIKNKRIFTTLAKAKALRKYVEPIITKSKVNTTHSKRNIFSYLRDKIAVSELFNELFEKVRERPGGYTRIIKTGYRLGDQSTHSLIELVDFNKIYTYKKKIRSVRRSRKKIKKVNNE
ncbi:50S ribosomal protein L17 [Blattabacterium cuenoti]|nr:50S ribosomal protein L17 [Blattabacterium cuenoti]